MILPVRLPPAFMAAAGLAVAIELVQGSILCADLGQSFGIARIFALQFAPALQTGGGKIAGINRGLNGTAGFTVMLAVGKPALGCQLCQVFEHRVDAVPGIG